jgi:hypothetical protein
MDAFSATTNARGPAVGPILTERPAAPLRRIHTIQYLRAFAAIFVLLFLGSFFVGQAGAFDAPYQLGKATCR